MTRALIVVDVQNDFITGSLAIDDSAHIPGAILDHIAESNYDLLVATQDWHIDPGSHWSETPDFIDSWPRHCAAWEEGAALHELLDEVSWDAIFLKGQSSAAYSGFEGTAYTPIGLVSLGAWLDHHGVIEVDVVGLAFDYCVKATALDAVKDFKTRVLIGLTQPVTPEGYLAAFDEMARAGVIFG